MAYKRLIKQQSKTTSSYDILMDLFRGAKAKAKRSKRDIRLLRIGTPENFWKQVIMPDDGVRRTEIRSLLVDPDIGNIEVLLVNPFCDAFLNRMDREDQDNWYILQTNRNIVNFVTGLLELAEERGRSPEAEPLRVGIHRADLIWNMGIVGDDVVMVRAYDKDKAHDDDVKELRVHVGLEPGLGESFINYCQSIRNLPSTRWFTNKEHFEIFSGQIRWPNLFKGNAVWSPHSDENLTKRDTEPLDTDDNHTFYKICLNENAAEAERAWLEHHDKHQQRCCFFHVPKLRHRREFKKLKREALCIEYVHGHTLFKLAAELNQLAAEEPAIRDKAKEILGLIVAHSIEALAEFRSVYNDIKEDLKLKPSYPYSNNLADALDTVLPYLTALPQGEVDKALAEARRLGSVLEKKARVPFRDAHLKNRLVPTDRSVHDEVRCLTDLDFNDLCKEFLSNIVDIDFETGYWLVTEWDDIAHLLFFEHTGQRPKYSDMNAVLNRVRPWTGNDEKVTKNDEELFYKTVMVRALREFCRRLWYARVMQNTYTKRYKLESRDYFLKLAKWASGGFGGYTYLKGLVKHFIDNADYLWNWVEDLKQEGQLDRDYTDCTRDEMRRILCPRRDPPPPSKIVLKIDMPNGRATFFGIPLGLAPAVFQVLRQLGDNLGKYIDLRAEATNLTTIRNSIKDRIERGEIDGESVCKVVLADADAWAIKSNISTTSIRLLLLELVKTRRTFGTRLVLKPSQVLII